MAHMRAHVSGYPPRYWPLKTLVILQAYVDDSASDLGDQKLFLAGYVSNADTWIHFSQEWDAALSADPKIEYLHMVEAQNLRGEFRGWSADKRDAKLVSLARVIERHRFLAMAISVSRREYATVVAPYAPYNLKSPYFGCFWGIVTFVWRYLDGLGLGEKDIPTVDFIFDEHSGLSAQVPLFFGWLKDIQPPEWKRFIGSTPIFRDDRKIVALQAADMLAWHLRRNDEKKDAEKLPALRHLLSGSILFSQIDNERLESIANNFKSVPSVDLVQTKTQWQATKRRFEAMVAAGAPAPGMSNFRIRLERLRLRFQPSIKRARRALNRYFRL